MKKISVIYESLKNMKELNIFMARRDHNEA